MRFSVALLQVAFSRNDKKQNLAKGLECCREAKKLGADLAVFPELWSIGGARCPVDAAGRESWVRAAIGQRSDFLSSFAGLAGELSLNIAVTYLEAHAPKPRNSLSIIDRKGTIALKYSKVFLCNFGEAESLKAEPDPQKIGCDIQCSAGESFDVCTLSGAEGDVRVGAMICADREFPEPAGELTRNGAELIVVPNACDWDDIRTAGLKTRAFENLVGIAMANYPEPINNGESQAYTCVAWKGGKAAEMLVAKAGAQEQILLARFDMDEIRAFRQEESWRLDYRRHGVRMTDWWQERVRGKG